jgi:hypothetical protein
VNKEAAGWARRRHQRPGEQGGNDGVCKRDLAVRENGGGHDQKTEEGTWWFPNPPISID